MKILLIGNGGREHAFAWKLKQDDPQAHLFIAPGNAGTALLGENIPLSPADLDGLSDWAQQHQPDITIVGPEIPLCAGIVDRFQAMGFVIFGPNQAASKLEGSKAFTKELLTRYHIPTARWKAFTDPQEAYACSQQWGAYPHVIKADGLASGKGAFIAHNPWEATRAIHNLMEAKIFGAAGEKIIIEDFLRGREASIFAIADGSSYKILPVAQDHKRIGEGDTGPNTGGMGAYAPAPLVDEAMMEQIHSQILSPLFEGLRQEGIDFRGVLYAGLMLNQNGPFVFEFNVRFGDPEAQVLLPLMASSFIDLVKAVDQQQLESYPLRFHPDSAVTVVMAAKNYPHTPQIGDVIHGLGQATLEDGQVFVFHAGTQQKGQDILTAGGRVLAVTALGAQLEIARAHAYQAVSRIQFSGAYYRRDIAAKTELTSPTI